MGPLPNGGFGAGVGGCKRRISAGNTQSTSEKRYPSSTVCGGGMHTVMVLEDLGESRVLGFGLFI
jgi:hypothetical protein